MRYIIGFVLSVILLIFTFVLIFRGGGDDPASTPTAALKLVDYADTDVEMYLSVDYPVSADMTHTQTVFIVGRDTATFTAYRGYEGEIITSQSYTNNSTAYANFLRALQLSGFTTGIKDDKLNDERGYCPTGKRYLYEIKDGSRSLQRYWSTSCSATQGSFRGKASTIRSLFVEQIPDYSKLTQGIFL